MSKHIFVTGGVVSSLGKGLTASSLGFLLKARGYRVVMQKCDPYLNVDPGTMNPFQHGEVFVTGDGTETDLDIGHYERFLDTDLPGGANVTTGQVYSTVIGRERRGEFLGDTVQVVPHITDEIQARFLGMHGDDVDVVITEVGGTVGDIESLPFLEAVRQFRHRLGRRNVFLLHVSLIPFIGPSGELKTKPTQHSVGALRNLGLQPDGIVLRADRDIPRSIRQKIEFTCDIEHGGVAVCVDAPSIYNIPKALHGEGLDEFILRHFGLDAVNVDWTAWDGLLANVHTVTNVTTVAVVGKYVDLPDAYLSMMEATRHAGYANGTKIAFQWVPSDSVETVEDAARILVDVDAMIVPGGFGVRGTEGMITALQFARETGLPTLGICLGMQMMVVECARNQAGLTNADSIEFDARTPHPVVTLLEGQDGANLGGTLRLGDHSARLTKKSVTAELYGAVNVVERHRHRYEVNPAYIDAIENAGLQVVGKSPEGLVDFVENPTHPFYVGTQAHPEYLSRPTRPHPLFDGLIKAAGNRDDRSGK
jgi:CTP synthase